MSIIEHFEGGKVAKSRIKHVLTLIEIDRMSFEGSNMQIYMHERMIRGLKDRREDYDSDTILGLYEGYTDMIAHYSTFFAQGALDFYEFFYSKEDVKKRPNEYFYFQFPIDVKKFKKLRVPEKKILKALEEIEIDRDTIQKYTEKNIESFYKSFEVAIKKPTINSEKKIIDAYVKKLKKKKG